MRSLPLLLALPLILAAGAPSSHDRLGLESVGSAIAPQEDEGPRGGLIGIGIGGGAGGRFGPRFGKKRLEGTVDDGVEPIVESGLRYLAGHGHEDLSLRGQALALLALLGDGHTMTRGEHQPAVRIRIRTLLERVRKDGRFSTNENEKDEALTHMLATLALAECYFLDKSVLVKAKTLRAVERARALVADAKQRDALSDGALIVGLELLSTVRDARIEPKGLVRLLPEADRRSDSESTSLLVHAIAVGRAESSAETRRRADALAERAIEELPLGADATADEAFRAWRVTETLRDAGGEAWAAFGRHRHGRLAALQVAEGKAVGAFGAAGDRDAVIARTAASVLALEAEFRFRRPSSGR